MTEPGQEHSPEAALRAALDATRSPASVCLPEQSPTGRGPSERGSMDFGIFTEQLREGGSQDGWFQEIQEFAEKGEAWGLDVLWLAEMLVNPARPGLSAPLLVASSIAAQTRALPVGTPGQPLPP